MSAHVDGPGEMGDTALERELYATRNRVREATTALGVMRAERDRFAEEARQLRSEVGRLKAQLSARMREAQGNG